MSSLQRAFIALSAGRASVPPRTTVFVGDAFLAALPGYVPQMALDVKLVSVFPENRGRGLPSHQALIALFDPETGSPIAIMDGTHVTAARTAASSALATRVAARGDASVLAILGAGVQGAAHLSAVTQVRTFTEIRVASRDAASAAALAATHPGSHAVETFEDAVRGADVVCCCTHSPEPVLRADWLKPGAHVTSVGASPGGPELDAETIRRSVLIVEARDLFQPYPRGPHELANVPRESAVELGEILAGSRRGRTGDGDITLYKSFGHAAEDIAAATVVYSAARARGAGRTVEL